ncbi:MAG: cytochrome P450 [Verrucomicrobia bacterium]|jgi:cytochrome P450|nr:cytochrome P450 [Verrucomicrobiota bacterium]
MQITTEKPIPTYPSEQLERHADVGSATPISFRGYTAESLLRAYHTAGPVFETEINGVAEIILAGMDANEQAWRSPDDWSYHHAVAVFREELSKVHLTQLDGAPHRRKRRLLNKGFKNSSVMSGMEATAREIAEGLEAMVGTEVELHEALMKVFTRAQAASSVKVDLDDEAIERMVDFEEGFIGALFMTPEERELVYNRAAYVGKKEVVLNQLHSIVKARLEGATGDDLFDGVIHQKTSEAVEPLSEEELIYDAYLMLIAGTGNTSKLLCYLVDTLARNPSWTAELRAEIGEFDPTRMARGMQEFPLLKATLMETERLFPAAPVLPRVPARDIEFLGYPLATGTHCLHQVALMHYDETIYEDPFTFQPRRWLEHDYPKAAHGTFGGGSHVCLGMNVTRVQMPLAIASLLSGYDFEVTQAPRMENYAYPGEVDSQTLRINVKLSKRS